MSHSPILISFIGFSGFWVFANIVCNVVAFATSHHLKPEGVPGATPQPSLPGLRGRMSPMRECVVKECYCLLRNTNQDFFGIFKCHTTANVN